jgi:hypothetical protein
MPASVDIKEWNGPTASPTKTVKTGGTVRFKNADDPNVDLNNPMVIPTTGIDWSYRKWLRLAIGATGPNQQISNIVCYSDGANNMGTGTQVKAKANATYDGPSEAAPDGTFADFFTYTSAAPLSLGAGPFSGTNTDIGNFVILQFGVDSTASPGITPSETITFQYDEI